MSWNVSSQNATDSLKIQLTKPIARLVIKDLVKFDGLRTEVKSLRDVLGEANNKLTIQSILISNLTNQNSNLESIVKSLDSKFEAQTKLTEDLQKALKRSKRQSKLYKMGTTVGASVILLLMIK
jgi:reverse gyrase